MSTPIDPQNIEVGQRVQVKYTAPGIETVSTFVVERVEPQESDLKRIYANDDIWFWPNESGSEWFLLVDPIEEAVASALNELDEIAYWDADCSGFAAPKFLELLRARGYKVVKA